MALNCCAIPGAIVHRPHGPQRSARSRWRWMTSVIAPALLWLCVGGSVAAADAPIEPVEPIGPVELVRDGFEFTEGPAYDHMADVLYFSDIPANKIYALDGQGEFHVFSDDSDHTNGIVYAASGRWTGNLVACQMDGRVVVYDTQTGEVAEVLADGYDGQRFNAPNDLVIDAHDGVYFTDPLYRAPDPLPQGIQAVYYRAADGQVTRLTGDIKAPNGIALSPDGSRLYLIPTMQSEMLVYEVEGPGQLGQPEVLCRLRQPEGKQGTGGDGMAVDEEGNLYITSNLGVQIFSADGQYRGLIEVPAVPANVTFGGPDLKTLYITARKGLYRVAMPIAGDKPGNS